MWNRILGLANAGVLLQRGQYVVHRHPRLIGERVSERHLHQMIDQSPQRVEQTREREIEKAENEALRGRFRHEALDLLVASFDLLAVTVQPDMGLDRAEDWFRQHE